MRMRAPRVRPNRNVLWFPNQGSVRNEVNRFIMKYCSLYFSQGQGGKERAPLGSWFPLYPPWVRILGWFPFWWLYLHAFQLPQAPKLQKACTKLRHAQKCCDNYVGERSLLSHPLEEPYLRQTILRIILLSSILIFHMAKIYNLFFWNQSSFLKEWLEIWAF